MKKNSLNIENLHKGEVLKGRIENITMYGIFVKLPNSQIGLIHKEDVSYIKRNYPMEQFNIGEYIDVMVKSYDRNTGKLSLSYKDANLLSSYGKLKFKEGDIITGTVKNHHENSVFIEVEPNIVGLANYKSGVSYGEKVKVRVKKILPESKKIKLEII